MSGDVVPGQRLLTFVMGEWTFALPLEAVKEVQRAAGVRAVFPGESAPVAVLSLRDETLPVWDLRLILKLPLRDMKPDGFLVITGEAAEGTRRAWVVDVVTEVLDVAAGHPVGLTGTPFDAMLSGVLRYGSLLVFRLDARRLIELAEHIEVEQVPARAEQPPPVAKAPDGEEMVVFTVGPQRYALPVDWIREIQPLADLTRVPCVPAFVRGVMNLRGGLLSVLDLHDYLGVRRPGSEEVARVIVLDSTELEVGIAAREVIGLVRVAPESKLAAMPTPGGVPAHFLDGMLGDLTLVLNASALLQDPRLIIDDSRGALR